MDRFSSAPLIQLKNVGVRADSRWLVEKVDFCVRRGEIVTMIGPNGSGKSTIAKVVTGLLRPSVGELTRVDRLRIGYVPQKLNIDRTLPLTVRRLMNLTGRYDGSTLAETLKLVGAMHLSDSPVQALSGGEFQRVLLARAIIGRPDLLVLDEPVQGVDFAGEVALYDLIGKIRDQINCGVLLISHDLHVVMAATDTVICLNGHVCCRGTPQRVLASVEYQKLFGPRAAQTLAVYTHDHDHTHLPDGSVDAHHDHGGHTHV